MRVSRVRGAGMVDRNRGKAESGSTGAVRGREVGSESGPWERSEERERKMGRDIGRELLRRGGAF